MSVEQLLLILPILTSLRQAGLTQTGGSNSCVLPDWRPKVLNRILSCYSFCRDVEEHSSGTTLPFPSLCFLSLSFVQLHASWDIFCKVWFFFFFFCKPDFLVRPSTQRCASLFFLCWKIPSCWTQRSFIFISQASVMAPGMLVFVCIVKSKSVCSELFDKIPWKSITISWASAVLCGSCLLANVTMLTC